MANFDFLNIEASVQDGKLVGEAKGILGPVLNPFLQQFFGKLNSLKVIAQKNGCNVYNLYNPPQPTPAGMRFLTRRLRMMLENRALPVTANLAITQRCQCNCIHCSAARFTDPKRRELTTEEIKTVVDGALDLEASLIIYVGGEPMLRDDLCELINYVDKSKAVVMIFTNGLRLTDENVKALAEAGLYSLNISIDAPDPEVHNRYRGVKECYEKAFEGAARAREAGILTGISTYATGRALRRGDVERILQIGQEEGFHEVTIFDCIPSGKFLRDVEKVLTPEEKRQVAELARKYHNMDHPMGVNAQAIINSPEGAGCYGARSQFYMTAYGDINPCDFNPITFGNVLEMPIQMIWDKMVHHPDFSYRHPTCRMQTPKYRKKYIDPIPDDMTLPVPVELVEQWWEERQKQESGAT